MAFVASPLKMAEELGIEVVEVEWPGYDLLSCGTTYKKAIREAMHRHLATKLEIV